MKITYNSIKNIFLVAVTLFLLSCEKEGDSYNISQETIFPSFEYERVVPLVIGEAYTPGAEVKEGETVLEYDISGTFDNTTPGIYPITYSAVNSDGYPSSVTQIVAVYDPAIIPTDVSGNIVDLNNASRTATISLVEGTTNIFFGSDMGFGGVFPLYFQMNGDVASVVNQEFPPAFGVESVDLSYDPIARTFSVLINPQGFAYTFGYR